MKRYLQEHRKVLGVIGGFAALVVAVIYLNVVPEEASTADGLHKSILVYGHPFCWLLLGGASFLWAMKKEKWAGYLAYGALAAYAVFIITFLITKSA